MYDVLRRDRSEFFSYNGKKIFYETQGDGKPLVFLHGNTSSSKLFKPMLPLYKDFQVILIDFLGYGRSDRLKKFPVELWKEGGASNHCIAGTFGYQRSQPCLGRVEVPG
jgi:pimeloyl-ACP methyl ester carboxylesterase